ncbi:MAG: hypothetical protein COB12_05790 [Flavobacterium sp.]|nr:MAG: hypothetical protein COB12_05790 [Flavobacterium sp.]
MKKTILFIGFLIGLNFNLLAQNINLNKSELESVLCKQWEIEYALIDGMKIGQIPGATDFDFKFKSDGKYDLIREEGNIENGLWVFDIKNKYVELLIKGKLTSRIKSIEKDKLILAMVSRQNDPLGLPSVEIHFKPI